MGYAISAIAALVTSYALARIIRWAEVDLWNGALIGILVWIGFVATVLAVTTYFGGRPRELWLINAGYQLVVLALMGASTASGTSPAGPFGPGARRLLPAAILVSERARV